MEFRYIFFCIFMLVSFNASGSEFAADLNGFRLWQYDTAADKYFGKPYKTFKREHTTIRAYGINDVSYMAFEYMNEKYSSNMYSIQITGYPTKMRPFKGVELGDPIDKVEKSLGKPSRSKPVPDTPYTINYYDGSNFSTEYDDKGKLYSIHLYVTKEFMDARGHTFDTWQKFKSAIKKKDVKNILSTFRPDVEIYRNNQILMVNKRYSDFVAGPDKKIVEALIGNKNSVREALLQSEPDGEMRLVMGMGVGQVFKFYKGNIVKEIVLFPYNQDYYVYEIAFQSKKDLKKSK